MCNLSEGVFRDALLQGMQEGMQQGIQQGIQQGALNTLVFLVRDGLLSVDVAAERTNMTKEEFEKILIES